MFKLTNNGEQRRNDYCHVSIVCRNRFVCYDSYHQAQANEKLPRPIPIILETASNIAPDYGPNGVKHLQMYSSKFPEQLTEYTAPRLSKKRCSLCC